MNLLRIKNIRGFAFAIIIVLLVASFPYDVHAGSIVNYEYEQRYSAAILQESRTETFTITIPQLGDRQRNIQVYLPPGYDSSEESYPVFYLFDGSFLFDPPPETIGDYQIDETLDNLYQQEKLKGVIVVGIEHDFDHPWSEYIPWVNENMHDWVANDNSAAVEGGEGYAFTDFIVQTLKPEIDSRYRTLTDKENTAIGGFCRMGLIPVVAAIKYPDTFGHIMSMSPAVWMAEAGGRWLSNNNMIKYINNNPVPDTVNFYVDIGTDEASGSRPPVRDQQGKRITYPRAYVEGAQALANALRNSGVPESNLWFRIIEGASGTRDVWAQRFDDVVLWFFGQEEVVEEMMQTEQVSEPNTGESSEEEAQGNQVFLPNIQTTETTGESDKPNIKTGIIIGSAVVIIAFGAGYYYLQKK